MNPVIRGLCGSTLAALLTACGSSDPISLNGVPDGPTPRAICGPGSNPEGIRKLRASSRKRVLLANIVAASHLEAMSHAPYRLTTGPAERG